MASEALLWFQERSKQNLKEEKGSRQADPQRQISVHVEGRTEAMAKRWAVVENGQPNVRPARKLVSDHPRASLDGDGAVDWSRSALLSMDLLDAGRGVLLVHVEGRGVVIKATANPAQELFASLAAPEMGVSVPRCRLVSPGESEHAAIREHVSALLTPNTYEHGIVSWTYLKQNLLLVMEWPGEIKK